MPQLLLFLVVLLHLLLQVVLLLLLFPWQRGWNTFFPLPQGICKKDVYNDKKG